MLSTLIVCLSVSALLCQSGARGQSPETGAQASSRSTPVGRWKTVDDITGKMTSVVAIWEQSGNLYGRIDRLLDVDPRDADPRCAHCEGELKDRPLIGLQILWDLQRAGKRWLGGGILDPGNGKYYKCSIALQDGGKKLRVRGFIGFPLLGRTQYWLREE